MTYIKNIWRIIRTKKSDRTYMERLILQDFITEPIRIILFPIALLVKLYKWTYS